MELLVTGLHIGLCFFLILVVLLQPGKGADFGAAMGGASQEVFGASGGVSLLSKITAAVAAMFMATSLSLAWFSNAPPGTDLMPEELSNAIDATEEVPLPNEATPTEEPAAEGTAPDPGTEPAAEPGTEPAADPGSEPAAEGTTGEATTTD